MVTIKPDSILLFIGSSGQGKSTLVKHYLNNAIPKWTLWDETGEYAKEGLGYWVNTIPQLTEHIKLPMLTFHNDHPDRSGDMERFCYTLWDHAVRYDYARNRALVFEECDLYFHPKGMPRYGWIIVFQGRHKNLLRIFVAKRIHTVNQNVVANANLIFLFQIEHEADTKTLKQFLGRNKEEREQNVEIVQNLPLHHYAIWDREARTLTTYKPLAIGKERIQEIRSTPPITA